MKYLRSTKNALKFLTAIILLVVCSCEQSVDPTLESLSGKNPFLDGVIDVQEVSENSIHYSFSEVDLAPYLDMEQISELELRNHLYEWELDYKKFLGYSVEGQSSKGKTLALDQVRCDVFIRNNSTWISELVSKTGYANVDVSLSVRRHNLGTNVQYYLSGQIWRLQNGEIVESLDFDGGTKSALCSPNQAYADVDIEYHPSAPNSIDRSLLCDD